MATVFLSNANTLHPFLLSSSTSPFSSSSSTTSASAHVHKPNGKRLWTTCKAAENGHLTRCNPILTKRSLSICFTATFLFSLANKGCFDANAAILEADDDQELLEKVKRDRKKRIERQGVINSANKETVYLQDLVYKLSKVGQAIENNDLFTASSVLGQNTDTDWVQNANIAFNKLSSSPEEKTEVDTFNSSLASLISSVVKKDIEASKMHFVSSASSFEKWTNLTGLVGQLKGL